MKIKHKLLEIDKELNSSQETGAFIHGLCDEIFLLQTMLRYYIAVAVANTKPDIFYGLRLSIEGAIVEWIFTGKSLEEIWAKKHKKYESMLKKMGVIRDENLMDVA